MFYPPLLRSFVVLLILQLSPQVLAVAPADVQPAGNYQYENEPRGEWLPVPIPMSNPTLGSGLQGVLLYLHPEKPGDDPETPTATSGLAGMYTDSDSKAVGIFHDNYFANDKYRLKLMAGVGDLNLDFYGIGDKNFGFRVGYNIRPVVSYLRFMVRVPGTKNSYMGVSHLYADATLKFRGDLTLDPERRITLPALEFDSRTSSLGAHYALDTRNDGYYPTKGTYTTLSATRDQPEWGSQYTFTRWNAVYRQYIPLTVKQTLAVKANLSDVNGEPPFYFLSSLQMRGFAGGRYLDDTSLSTHAEWRYKFSERWGTVAFAEAGWTGESIDELFSSDQILSYGVGLRWQPIASKQLNLAVDVAESTDDRALYLRVGEAF